jgi:threonine synthase
MTMSWTNTCLSCGRSAKSTLEWRCECGGAFETRVSSEYRSPSRAGSIFERFAHLYPYLKEGEVVSLGEGETPLVKAGGTLFKLEYLLPTGSFKDRGSCAMVSGVKEAFLRSNLRTVKEDSSGNAGASVAAYCARAGIGCEVYVPERVAGPKALQTQMYGARLVRVSGSRNDVTTAAQAEGDNAVYLGHIWHPFFRDGVRTLAYEIFEQTNGDMPSAVFLPVSAGTLLLGFIAGLNHLKEAGAIKEVPRVVACQSAVISPLHSRMMGLEYQAPSSVETVADALVSTAPPLLEHMVNRLSEIGGDTEIVTEEEILIAWRDLARMGLYAEPSSAVAFACLAKRALTEEELKRTVVILTGSGLKSRESVMEMALR